MVYSPLWLSVEEGAGRVEVNHVLVDEGSVALLRVLLGSVTEEATAYGFLHTHRGLSTRHHIQLMSMREKQTLCISMLPICFNMINQCDQTRNKLFVENVQWLVTWSYDCMTIPFSKCFSKPR